MTASVRTTRGRTGNVARSVAAFLSIAALALTGAAATTAATAAPSVTTSAACAAAWTAQSYAGDSVVSYNGHNWNAKWWAEPTNVPGAGDPWEDQGACDGAPGGDTGGGDTGGGDTGGGGDTTAGSGAGDSAIHGYRRVGYFAQWGIYGRDFMLNDMVNNGSVNDLTHLNYAFIDVTQDATCKSVDTYADFEKHFTADEAVDGVADSWATDDIAGNFGQLKKLKSSHPHLRVVLSLGGWTLSKYFSTAVSTAANRQKLAASCISQFIDGDISGKAGWGAGIVDGFDIDWEWPAASGNDGNVIDMANDKANFKAFLKEFREQLDAKGTANGGKHYLLSAFLPAAPATITAGGWNDPEIFNYLDYGNVQGYDFWGAWDLSKTGHQSNLFDDPADNRPVDERYSIDKAIKTYTNNGVNPTQLGVGLAQYARGWQGATSSNAWQGGGLTAAEGEYEAGVNDYDVIKDVGQGFYDASIGAAWRYDAGTGEWWSYDNAQTIQQKAQYIADNNLGGGMFWELDGDSTNVLPNALDTKLGTLPEGPVTGGSNPGGGDTGGGDTGGGDTGGGDTGGGDTGGGDTGGGDTGGGDNGGGDNGGGDTGGGDTGGGDTGGGDTGGGDTGGGDTGGGDTGGANTPTPPTVTWKVNDYQATVSGLRTKHGKAGKVSVQLLKNGAAGSGTVTFTRGTATTSVGLVAGRATLTLPKLLAAGTTPLRVAVTPAGSAEFSRTVMLRVNKAKAKFRVIKPKGAKGVASGKRITVRVTSTKGVKLKGKLTAYRGKKKIGQSKIRKRGGKWAAKIKLSAKAKSGKVIFKLRGNKNVTLKVKGKLRVR